MGVEFGKVMNHSLQTSQAKNLTPVSTWTLSWGEQHAYWEGMAQGEKYCSEYLPRILRCCFHMKAQEHSSTRGLRRNPPPPPCNSRNKRTTALQNIRKRAKHMRVFTPAKSTHGRGGGWAQAIYTFWLRKYSYSQCCHPLDFAYMSVIIIQ